MDSLKYKIIELRFWYNNFENRGYVIEYMEVRYIISPKIYIFITITMRE